MFAAFSNFWGAVTEVFIGVLVSVGLSGALDFSPITPALPLFPEAVEIDLQEQPVEVVEEEADIEKVVVEVEKPALSADENKPATPAVVTQTLPAPRFGKPEACPKGTQEYVDAQKVIQKTQLGCSVRDIAGAGATRAMNIYYGEGWSNVPDDKVLGPGMEDGGIWVPRILKTLLLPTGEIIPDTREPGPTISVRQVYKFRGQEIASSTVSRTALESRWESGSFKKEEVLAVLKKLGFGTAIDESGMLDRFKPFTATSSKVGSGKSWFLSGFDTYTDKSKCRDLNNPSSVLVKVNMEMNEITGDVYLETDCTNFIID